MEKESNGARKRNTWSSNPKEIEFPHAFP